MNKILKKIDSYMLCIVIELFLVVSLFVINKETTNTTIDFIMLCITFFTVIITYISGIVVGLILSSIIVFSYASYIFYMNLIKGVEIQFISYVWLVSIPLLSYTMGKLSSHINTLQQSNIRLIKNHKDLITIDKETGLGNIKLFYMNLEKEISKSSRHNTPCTLMLIKLPYYKEIRKIIGESKTNKLIKDISDVITNSTRNEDDRYTLENDTLAVIMSVTDLYGASIVKNRIKDHIEELNLKLKENKDYVNIDVKIAVLQYSKEIKSAMEFKILAEEELQYDV